MSKEIEVKVLGLDIEKFKKNLVFAGGIKKKDKFLQRRYVFDIAPGDPTKWIRLRTDGERSTLAVKIINSDELDGTLEYETVVEDFDTTKLIIEKLGFIAKSYQENYREIYMFDQCEISIDWWPKLEPYAEIEAGSESDIANVLKKLNLLDNETTSKNTKKLYADIGVDLDDVPSLVF